ncbi:MAG: RluA family pseudouridine synthase [Clostridiaceae bacterium]|nr:RluA family pseudouridine synthase [Clostridiaceae bacterium]
MELEEIVISKEEAGLRLDSFLSDNMEELSRNRVQALCSEGRILINGGSAKKNQRLKQGDTVTVDIPEPTSAEIKPQDIPLDIVYEDQSILIINKPKGMVVHPAPGHPDGTVVNAVMYHCGASLSGIGGEIRPGIVHRIDKDTSGLLMIAKNDRAHMSLANQLKDRSLSRLYEAIVLGTVRDDSGTIDAPIGRSLRDRKKMAVLKEGGRRAVTHYETIARYIGFTHVRCGLETGRTHQIRVHMAYIGHPVAGDEIYGKGSGKTGLDGQCLHAGQIKFVHPDSGEHMSFECPLPRYFIEFEERLRVISE